MNKVILSRGYKQIQFSTVIGQFVTA